MTNKPPRACITCFHGNHDRIAGALFCRRYPRQVVVNTQPGEHFGKVFSHYPAHEPTDVCGEYTKSDSKITALKTPPPTTETQQ